MGRRDVIDRIRAFNQGRDPAGLERKYEAMRSSPLGFLRGTAHLFYDEMPRAPVVVDAPAAWISGDLHLQNFGTYKGDNRQVYFDVDDFDEGALAPCTWDVLRLSTSLLVVGRALGLGGRERRRVAKSLVEAYAAALEHGKARWVERETAEGLVRTLFDRARLRRRRQLLDGRTVVSGARRRLRTDGKRALPATPAERKRVMAFMRRFAQERGDRGLEPLDVARRIAGTGSLGLERYVILVRGRGSSEGNLLLDLKLQPPSPLRAHLTLPQPRWGSEAERVVEVQRRAQAIAPAFLAAVRLGKEPFVLKEVQPSADKVDLERWRGRRGDLDGLARTLGEVAAWSHLRSGGRQGSATADRYIAFGARAGWRRDLLALAREMAAGAEENWRTFRRAGPLYPSGGSRDV